MTERLRKAEERRRQHPATPEEVRALQATGSQLGAELTPEDAAALHRLGWQPI